MAVIPNPTRRQAEIGFAAVLLAAAAWGWTEARGYGGASGIYPQVLCILLMIGSAIAILRAALTQGIAADSRLFEHAPRFVLGFAAIALYVVAIDLAGYILPSLIFGIGLPMLLGYRKLQLLVPVVCGVILFVYVVFGILLERPLPPDVFLELFT